MKTVTRVLAAAGAIGVLVGVYCWATYYSMPHFPGNLAHRWPEQTSSDGGLLGTIGRYDVYSLARYEVDALVLGVRRYSGGREAKTSRVDWVLGWGPMSNPDIVKHVAIRQKRRRYSWYVQQWRRVPVGRKDIEYNSANTHIIAGTPEVEQSVRGVQKGALVSIRGHLARVVSKDDGWRWLSSLTRKDTESGACELLFVTALTVKAPEPHATGSPKSRADSDDRPGPGG